MILDTIIENPNEPRYNIIQEQIKYWHKWWDTDRNNNRKGILKIKIDGKI